MLSRKKSVIARDELYYQVVIINEWYHQCIIPIYYTVMTMPLTAAPKELLGESVKQILNAIPNKHLLGYNERTTSNDYP